MGMRMVRIVHIPSGKWTKMFATDDHTYRGNGYLQHCDLLNFAREAGFEEDLKRIWHIWGSSDPLPIGFEDDGDPRGVIVLNNRNNSKRPTGSDTLSFQVKRLPAGYVSAKAYGSNPNRIPRKGEDNGQ